MRQALGLTKLSSLERAMDAGERFVAEFDLGPVPGLRLAEVMEDRLGILVFSSTLTRAFRERRAVCRTWTRFSLQGEK